MNAGWARVIIVLLLIFVIFGMAVNEWRSSLGVWEAARFNLMYVDQEGKRVSVISFDPVEQKVMILEYPESLSINSRSVGEYKIGNLYSLGKYRGQGGEFARRKVQGFMRMPITGFMVDSKRSDISVKTSLSKSLISRLWRVGESNLSRFDSYTLWHQLKRYNATMVGEDELVRAGIIVKKDGSEGYGYMPERLSQYVGKQFFDWGVGIEGATVAVINESGIDGMGSDMAGFLTNMGLDVVVVRSGKENRDTTKIAANNIVEKIASLRLIDRAFGFGVATQEDTQEYRADIVFWVGKDATDLF